MSIAMPFAVGDFGLTNMYQTLRKAFVTILLSSVGTLVSVGGLVPLIIALMLGILGLRLAFFDLDFIPTSLVVTNDLEPRIPGISEVVVVNNRGKLIMNDPIQENPECWLPDQRFLNRNCKPTEIPGAIDSVLPNLRYEETIKMQDVTGLDRVEFTDKFDLGQTNPNICEPHKTTEVHFLDKFGDLELLDESETGETCENDFLIPEKRYLRTRNQP